MGEVNLSAKFGYKPTTVNNYISYAKGSASDREQANYTYRGQDRIIRYWIDKHIDAGRHCDLRYRSFEKTGPTKNKKHASAKVSQPIKPVTMTQLPLDFTPQKEERPSAPAPVAKFTKEDVMAIVKQMYEVTMEALRKV